jgi:hypothetical protein
MKIKKHSMKKNLDFDIATMSFTSDSFEPQSSSLEELHSSYSGMTAENHKHTMFLSAGKFTVGLKEKHLVRSIT